MIEVDTVEALRDVAKSRPISEVLPGRMEDIYLLASVAADEIASLRAEVSYLNGALADSERLAMAMTRQVNSRVDRENDVVTVERESILAFLENTGDTSRLLPDERPLPDAMRLEAISLFLKRRLGIISIPE